MNKLFKYITPETLLDIGANIGEFSLGIKNVLPTCKIVMVEANPFCRPYLQQANIPFDIVALSDKEITKEFFINKVDKLNTGASFYKENTQFYSDNAFDILNLNTYRLDSMGYFTDELIDLIKLDVQGSELDIIEGGLETIKKTKFILCELSLVEYNIGAPNMQKVVERLQEVNFGIVDILEYHYLANGSIFQLDILFKNLSF